MVTGWRDSRRKQSIQWAVYREEDLRLLACAYMWVPVLFIISKAIQ